MTLQLLDTSHFAEAISLSEALKTDPSPCSFWSLTEERLLEWIKDPCRITVVTLEENRIAGVGAIQRGGRHQAHLAEISVAVHPEFRRAGLARNLVVDLEERVELLGAEIIKALIWVENRPSRKLFESLGYEHKATLMAEFKSESIGEIDDAVYYIRIGKVTDP